jgi:hypothetical protein
MTSEPPETELIHPLWETVNDEAVVIYGFESVRATQFESQGEATGVDNIIPE